MIPLPHPQYRIFSVQSGQEMGLAPVATMNLMRNKFFLYYSCLSRGFRTPRTPLNSSLNIIINME